MATISVTLPADGETIDATDVINPINTIVTAINGNLDSNNLASNAVTTSKITDSSVIFSKLATAAPVQMVSTSFSAVATGTTILPQDDTIPQITEGNEFMTQAITPKATTDILVIEVTALLASNVAAGFFMAGALFQDATANALAATEQYCETQNGSLTLTLRHTMAAGTVSSTTFRFRAGTGGAGTTTFNGVNATRRYGAITKSCITITEYKA